MASLHTDDPARTRSVVEWPAIFAGAAIAAGATVVFTGFTAALGLGSMSAQPNEGMGWFSALLVGLFGFVTMVGSYALGGYVAGRMRTRHADAGPDEVKARDGVHGLTVWAIGTLIGALLTLGIVSGGLRAAGGAASAVAEAGGSAVGGALQGAGQLAGGVAGGVGQVAGGAIGGIGQLAGGAVQGAGNLAGDAGSTGGVQANPLDYVTDRLLRSEAQAPDAFSNERIGREIATIAANVLRTGELSDDDRAYLERAVAARTQLSEREVAARVDEAVTRIQALRAEAEERVEQARVAAEDAMAQARQEAEQLRAEAEQRLQDARQTAIAAAESARRAAVWTALLLTISSLVAAVVAFLAAIKGGEDRDNGRVWGGLLRTDLPRPRR